MAIAHNTYARRRGCVRARIERYRARRRYQQALQEFAEHALETMERDRDWTSDTMSDIANKALESGLADIDDELYLRRARRT